MPDTANSLYAAWYEALPVFFRSMMPPGWVASSAPEPTALPPGLSSPADQVGKALEIMSAGLTQLYQSYLPLLGPGTLNAEAFKAVLDAGSEASSRLREAASRTSAALPGMPSAPMLGAFPLWNAWWSAWAPARTDAAVSDPLQVGMERVFGGLGDAFGLRPARELDAAWREIAAAAAGKQRVQAEYLALWAEAWRDGTQRMLRDLAAMAERGERVESMLALTRLWAKGVDGAVHEAMQSERGLALTAEVMRAATSYRRHVQKAVALASESMDLPTRADVDEAYREIQELKREVRRLRKALPAAEQRKLRRARASDA